MPLPQLVCAGLRLGTLLVAGWQKAAARSASSIAGTLAAMLVLAVSVAFSGCAPASNPVVAQPASTTPAVATARPTLTATPTPSPSPTSTPTPRPKAKLSPSPTATFPPLVPTVTQVDSLTVEQYPVVATGVDTPDHLEYLQRLGQGTLQKRAAWRSVSPSVRIDHANAILGRFGYRLLLKQKAGDDTTYYDLLRGESPVKSDFTFFSTPSVNDKGTDFALIVEDKDSIYLVRNGSATPWEASQHAYTFPVFAGDDLVSVMVDETNAPEETLSVLRGDKPVFSLTVPGPTVSNPVKKLAAWNGHWVLEVDGQVWVEGQNLGRQQGYAEVFGWQLLAGKPFYFYRPSANGPIRLSYDGRDLPLSYDEVIHYQCCEPAIFNVQGNDSMVWFHASRDGKWYYVEIGNYTTSVTGAEPASPSSGILPASDSPEPALRQGTLEQAETAVGFALRIPTYLPEGAIPEGPVSYYAEEGRGLISLRYHLGSHTLAVELHIPPLEDVQAFSDRVAPVGGYPALILTQPSSADAATPTSIVTWRDGPVTYEVKGDLPVDELVAVAQSMY